MEDALKTPSFSQDRITHSLQLLKLNKLQNRPVRVSETDE
jgi:hypothetical protein